MSIEQMQDKLAAVDPNTEQELAEQFEDYVASCYHAPGLTRVQRQNMADAAEVQYAAKLEAELISYRIL